MSVKERFLDVIESEQKIIDKIDSFNEKFYDYLNAAFAGENPYKLEIDKKWAKFMYKSSKMTFIKIVTILVTIAPSFTKIYSTIFLQPVIKECFIWPDTKATQPWSECLKYNNDSPIVKNPMKIEFDTLPGLLMTITVMLLFSLPHFVFMGMIWWRFRMNKYSIWISAAKIHLQTFEKVAFTCLNYIFLIGLTFGIYKISELMATATKIDGQRYSVPYPNDRWLTYTFEKTDPGSPLGLLSTGLVYSCLITVLLAQIRQPMSFYSGFRQSLKKASRVPYNVWAVDYRIKRDPVIWRFIDRYYQECLRYDSNIVLMAMTTHFIDLKLLTVEGEEEQ